MTSEQIRQIDLDTSVARQGGENRYQLLLLEIAAQLAELNEFLRDPKQGVNVNLCATNDNIPVTIR